MFREILAPLDGSAHSAHALPLAAAIADLSGGRLTLTRGHTPAARIHSGEEAPQLLETDALAIEGARRYLEGLSGDVASTMGR